MYGFIDRLALNLARLVTGNIRDNAHRANILDEVRQDLPELSSRLDLSDPFSMSTQPLVSSFMHSVQELSNNRLVARLAVRDLFMVGTDNIPRLYMVVVPAEWWYSMLFTNDHVLTEIDVEANMQLLTIEAAEDGFDYPAEQA